MSYKWCDIINEFLSNWYLLYSMPIGIALITQVYKKKPDLEHLNNIFYLEFSAESEYKIKNLKSRTVVEI